MTPGSEGQITLKTMELDKALKERISSSTDSVERSQIRAIIGKDNSKTLSALRREIVAASEDSRLGIMSVVDEYLADVETTEALFKSPLQVLSRHEMGNPEKTQVMSQLAGAGPAELQSIIDYSVASGDKLTLSAALLTVDRGGKRFRSINKMAIAEAAMGPEVEAMKSSLADMKVRLQAMRTTNRSFSTGNHSSKDKIMAGLAARQLGKS